jgi:PAS domain S-box-containing protein
MSLLAPSRAKQQAFRIALVYIIVAGSWTLFSNELLKRYGGNLKDILEIDTIKDWGFMIIMAGLLHQALRHLLRKWEREMELRKESEENLRRTERALKTISACNGALVRATSEAMLLAEICRVVVEKGEYRLAWVGFAENGEKKSITIAAQAGHDNGYLEQANINWSDDDERGRGPVGTAIRTGEIVVCNDFQTSPLTTPWRQAATQHGFASSIVLPLRHAEKSLGVLTIYAAEVNAFNLTEIELLHELAEDLGYGIQVLRARAEHLRAEETLRESEKKFSKIFHSSPVPVWLSTIREGRFLDANNEFLKLIQRSREEVIGHTSFELNIWTNPEQRTAIVAKLESHESVRNVELETCTKSGELRSILWSAEAVGISGERCWLGSALDITEHKRAEERVHLQSTALTAAANAIMITDCHGTIEWVNPAFSKLTGYSAAEIIGANPRLLKSGRHPPAFYGSLWATILTGNVWHGEFVNQRKNGQLYTEDTTITPVRGTDGQIAHFVAIKQDVTERHLLESQLRQSQKMEAIGQLAGGVAHDFNNILAALLMQTQLVEMIEQLPQEAVDGLEQIRAFTNRASDLTRQLLLFSRRQVMQPGNLDLNEIVTNLAKMLQRIIGEDVRLQLNLYPVPLITRADAGMLEQVLLNLAVNARDAMPKGGQMRIDTTQTDVAETAAGSELVPGHYVCFSVSDTGSGIPPEILPKIFEPFFTTKEAGKGTGLGLATVFGIVKQHQGWIKVDNRPGRGVTFQVYLPANTTAVAKTPPIISKPKPRGGKETILLVEDEWEVRDLIRKILIRHGYQVLEATNGVEAISVWQGQSETVALLVTDLVMPAGLSGQELARQLQAAQPNLKVVFISGYSAEIAGRELQLHGGEAFIQKPFATDHLLETIRRILDT